MKKILLAAFVAVSALTYAQRDGGGDKNFIAGTHGQGVAMTKEKRRAEFGFRVHKILNKENKEVTMGEFNFHQGGNPGGEIRPAGINLRGIGRLAVDGNTARFGGKAILMTVKDGKRIEIKGEAVIVVMDNKKPGEGGGEGQRNDFIKVHFKAADSDLTFDFEGAVGRGDLVVRKKKNESDS